ncbi:glutamine amidotransferase [Vibrio palustris]|uniref:GMP synthase [glutamine-hydrolyzing] n=1 Tax=Vibrio palustris TaxID=1918946 RepID=A0A1R4B6G6_9VIBR|nr:glutamine amidotransferase [Vibrio palustris]SJL84509.1 GMP synthase [glutamine-hydrolyzing] [Vibrio palustris]
MNKLLIIETGTAPEALKTRFDDLADWFYVALGFAKTEVEIIRVYQGESLPQPSTEYCAIITGSWAMVTDHEPWSEYTAEWIRQAYAVDMPMLGVCYGHQLMAYALGGEVGYFAKGREMGCFAVTLQPQAQYDPLLQHLPLQFFAHLSHSQRVIKAPKTAKVLAASQRDPHQIIRYSATAISTQFHPEFTTALLKASLDITREDLINEGENVEMLKQGVKETPDALSVLQRFVACYMPQPVTV